MEEAIATTTTTTTTTATTRPQRACNMCRTYSSTI